MEVKYCKKCLMPNTRPRITFNADGVCNACEHAENKYKNIDWDARKQEFLKLIEPYKTKDGYWDCIVPWSGGKDSSTIAYRLKFEFGMNPLLVTFSPQLPTEIGDLNREEMIKLGFDNIFLRPNQKTHRRLAKRFFIERGDQKVPWNAGINATPVKIAVKLKIPLVFYAEHGESEYGGKIISEEHRKMRDFTEVIEHQIGDDPKNWVDEKITINDLNPYVYPDAQEIKEVGVKALYFGYFFKWSMFDNYNFIKTKINFHTHPSGRTPGTIAGFDSVDDKSDILYYYMQYIKFGFGRAIRDTSRMIQNNQMTREEALKLAKQYDGEFCNEYLDEMLEYLNLNREEFDQIVDKHRNPEIWKKENGQWKLRYPLE